MQVMRGRFRLHRLVNDALSVNVLQRLARLALRLHADDVLYTPLPLYHNNALTVSWGAVLAVGATLALGRKFSASRFWDEIRHYEATSFCYIGELCRYLLNRPATPRDRDHRVRVITGNGLRPEIWDAFQQRFGIERRIAGAALQSEARHGAVDTDTEAHDRRAARAAGRQQRAPVPLQMARALRPHP